jgi:hypothetical protein
MKAHEAKIHLTGAYRLENQSRMPGFSKNRRLALFAAGGLRRAEFSTMGWNDLCRPVVYRPPALEAAPAAA